MSPRGCRERTEQSDARDRRYGVSVYVIATTYTSIRQASARSRSLSLAAPNLHQRIPKTCAIVRSERLYGLCGADIIGSPVKPRASYSVRALQPVRRGGKNKNPAVCDTAVVSAQAGAPPVQVSGSCIAHLSSFAAACAVVTDQRV